MKLLVICVYGRSAGIHTVCSEEGDGSTSLTSTTCTTDTVDVILRVVGIVIVQHMSDIANVFTITIG